MAHLHIRQDQKHSGRALSSGCQQGFQTFLADAPSRRGFAGFHQLCA